MRLLAGFALRWAVERLSRICDAFLNDRSFGCLVSRAVRYYSVVFFDCIVVIHVASVFSTLSDFDMSLFFSVVAAFRSRLIPVDILPLLHL